jgi:hypothetical protein
MDESSARDSYNEILQQRYEDELRAHARYTEMLQ